MSFDIQIKVDPSQAIAGIDKTTAKLGGMGAAAAEASATLQGGMDELASKTKKTTDKMGEGFDSVGRGVDKLGSLLTGGAIGAGLLALGQQIDGLIQQERELEDEYTNLVNHEMKFVDATHTLIEVQQQQRDLSVALHSTMKDSLAVYDSVQDALVDMNLSSRDLAIVTKVVGQEAIISGKSMDSAGEVLNRMTLAMDSGVNAGRALKQALVGYDAISDTLTAHFHTTRAGLIELVNQHKIGSREIVEALMAEAAQVQKNADKRTITNEQTIAQIHEQANALRQQGVPSLEAYQRASNEAYAKSVEGLKRATNAQYDQQQALAEALPQIEQLTKDLENQSGAFAKIGEYEHKAMGAMVGDFAAAADGVHALGNAIEKALGKDAWAGLDDKTGLLSFLPKGTEAAMKHAAAVGEAKRQLGDLNAAYKAGAIDAEAYRKQWESLTTTIEGRLPAVYTELHKLHDPIVDARRDLGALDTLLKQGKISWDEYADEAEKARAVLDKYKPVASVTGGHLAAPAPDGISNDVLFRASYASAQTPDPKAYDEFENRARDSLSGVDRGWKQIKYDATDSAKQIEDAMTGAFGAIQTSIEDMVTKGKFDLGSLASSLESILVKLAVQQATGSLIGALGGGRTGFDYMTPSGPGPALPGFATGGDMLVGGAGAPDSKLAMFRVSPGESIHVRTPEQRAAASTAGGAGGGTVNHNYFTFDPKALNKSIDSGVQKYIKENRTAVRALLGV